MKKDLHKLSKSPLVAEIPLACSDELAAIEFFERLRWGNTLCCVKCGSVEVYQMKDAKTGQRNKRYLWRCHDCKEQFTVRLATVYEESRLSMRHWAYAFWRACTSKKGVSALEIKRYCRISYKSALFLMSRIRFALAPDIPTPPFSRVVEVDKTYVGGKPRVRNSKTLKAEIRKVIDPRARIMSDEHSAYRGLDKEFASHEHVAHGRREYARGDVNTNTAESPSRL
jgi:transposase-like protein